MHLISVVCPVPTSFTDLSKYNLFSVCDCLKQFFRSLPEPLLGFELYKLLLAVQSKYCSWYSQVHSNLCNGVLSLVFLFLCGIVYVCPKLQKTRC